MPYKRGIPPLTTWHSQGCFLLIALTWGMSYLMPANRRIAFSEVFPQPLEKGFLPMVGWGVVLVVSAIVAFVAERVIAHRRDVHPIAWRLGWGSHMILAGAYFTLAATALWQGLDQIKTDTFLDIFAGFWSAVSRPMLWGGIAFLHTTFARLPRPVTLIPAKGASDDSVDSR